MTREEALAAIKEWNFLDEKEKEVLHTLLPELKGKNEDEIIKKQLIEYFTGWKDGAKFRSIPVEKVLGWIKKQIPPKWLYRLEYKDGTCGLWYNGEGKWCFEQGIGSVPGCKTKDLPMDHDERYKQDGRDWFSSCSRKEDLMHWYSLKDAEELIKKGFVFTRYLATEYHEYDQETVFIKETSLVREEIDIFELFGKTKPIFKEGDWIIYRDEWTREVDVLMVSNPDLNGTSLYTANGRQKYYLDWDSLKSARLWKLDDAIPGDILSYRNGQWIFIYEGMGNEPITIKYYVLLSDKGINTNNYCETVLTECIKPATKKERDLLFTKLKETSYEWDGSKLMLINLKELNYSDEDMIKTVLGILGERMRSCDEGTILHKEYKIAYDWFVSIKDRITQEWTAEDKENYKEILTHLEVQGNSATLDVNRKKWRILESWFKRRVPELSFGEEDKKMIENIISDLKGLKENETNEELISDYERKIEWLKEKI